MRVPWGGMDVLSYSSLELVIRPPRFSEASPHSDRELMLDIQS